MKALGIFFSVVWVAGCAGSAASPATTPAQSPAVASPGLITVDSTRSFDDTVAALEAAIAAKGLNLFTRIEHHANASGVGLELPPTTVLVFGNPKVGTGLMQASRSAAIDLPQKMVVWQDADQVKITYNDPAWMRQRHGVSGKDAVFDKIAGLLGGLATTAAQ